MAKNKKTDEDLALEADLASDALNGVSGRASLKVDGVSLNDEYKPFHGFPRLSYHNFLVSGVSYKGSFTDKTKYIPLVESVRNLQQGKSINGAGSVNLVSDSDYDFKAGDKVPKDYKAHDGLLNMDIADVAQQQRDLQERIEKVEKEVKSLDDRASLEAIRRLVKEKKVVSKDLYAGLDDSVKKMLDSYNSTIQ